MSEIRDSNLRRPEGDLRRPLFGKPLPPTDFDREIARLQVEPEFRKSEESAHWIAALCFMALAAWGIVALVWWALT